MVALPGWWGGHFLWWRDGILKTDELLVIEGKKRWRLPATGNIMRPRTGLARRD